MAWVRIHDGALSHPKLVSLIDWRNPFCLWVWGLSYCQMHLTDGRIVKAALPSPVALKTAAKLIAARLWSDAGDAFAVHDYLEWNDSRAFVVEKRASGRGRVSKHRAKGVTPESSNSVTESGCNALLTANTHRIVGVSTVTSEKDKAFTDAAVTERAGRFIERYEALYEKHRNGARYLVKPHRDYEAAVGLCRTWTDDARLDKLAAIFLTTDHQFAESGSRTVPQFAALASWCDSKLTEWEAAHGSR